MKIEQGKDWTLANEDCVAFMRGLASESVDYSVSSIPFSSLFSYSDDPRDLSNCDSHEHFFEHFGFVARELFRVIKPGRLVTTHVMTLPTSKAKDGRIALYDFPGDTIRAFERAGFLFHSKVTVFKSPVVAMQRTKARGLLWKELRKNSAVSRMGLPDEVLTFRKPGENVEPITHTKEDFPVAQWQQWASPTWSVPDSDEDLEFFRQCLLLWDDIDQGDVLPPRAAREEDDQRHLCPLQKEVISRCVRLWSNPRDLVLSPFAGIGSEGYMSLQEGRRFIGAELKTSYWRQAVANLQAAERRTGDLFASTPGVAVPGPTLDLTASH
jgi:DNA modification methylase